MNGLNQRIGTDHVRRGHGRGIVLKVQRMIPVREGPEIIDEAELRHRSGRH
jgi:hypothetical protein